MHTHVFIDFMGLPGRIAAFNRAGYFTISAADITLMFQSLPLAVVPLLIFFFFGTVEMFL